MYKIILHPKLNLVEKHIINESEELNDLTFKCKNLYNKVLYITRQDYINNGIKPDKYNLYNTCKELIEYKELSARVSRNVIRTLVANWDSYFSTIRNWYKTPKKFNNKPNLPGYLDKKGRYIAIFSDKAVLRRNINKGIIGLSKLKLQIKYQHMDNDIIEVQVIPYKNKKYKINIVYYTENIELKKENNKYVSIDLGINNLMTITSNSGLNPIIVNGRPLKSINQFYNKKKAFYFSELEIKQKRKKSKKLEKLSYKRENKINDYLHKSSKFLIDLCLKNNINSIIIGYNKFWKQNIDLGGKNNQNFTQIPFYKLIEFIEYKSKIAGLNVIINEESYTSKCSFLDLETIKKQKNYIGIRTHRGLFKSGSGKLINADVNASYNIMRKVVPDVFIDGIEDISVYPIKISF